jgi:DNA gyrase subunit A
MAVVEKGAEVAVLTVCEKGFGKRTAAAQYPVKNRGGKGVISMTTSERNGDVVGVRVVSDEDHLILISDKGKLIRVPVAGVPLVGRNTQGVRIMRVEEGEVVSSVERLADPEDSSIEEAAPISAEEAAAAAEEAKLAESDADAEPDAESDSDDGGDEGGES